MALTFKHVLVRYTHIELQVRENMMFYSFDLDLDAMTLVLKFDLDMVKMYKNEVSSYSSSKVTA